MSTRAVPAFVIVSLLACAPVGAQERVEVDLETGFADPLPLDVEFHVVGKVPPGVDRVEFAYAPAAGEDPGYLPIPAPQRWERNFGDEFVFVVGPLHHRKRYRFEWRLRTTLRSLERRRPGLGEQVAADLRALLRERWRSGVLSRADAAALEARLLEGALGAGAAGEARLDRAAFDALVGELLAVDIAQEELAFNHGELCARPGELLGSAEAEELVTILRQTLAGELSIAPGSAARWRSRLDPRDRNNGTSLADAAQIAIWLADDARGPAEILAGRLTIHRASLLEVEPSAGAVAAGCVTGGADLPSLGILAAALDALTTIRSSEEPLLPPAGAAFAGRLAGTLRAYRDDARQLRWLREGADAAVDRRLAALALDTPIAWTATASAVPDRRHPYLGLDLGVAWVPAFDGVAFYTAVQLHAVPVNRAADLGQHRGADVLTKRVGLLLGLALTGVERDGRLHATGAGSPMAGLGVRLTRDVRVAGGWLWYDDPEGERIRSWFGALSFDIDLARFVGRLGRLFGA